MRHREHTDYDPRIRGDEVELLGGSQEQVQIGLQELIEVLFTHLRKSNVFGFVSPQAIPVQGTDLPVQDL